MKAAVDTSPLIFLAKLERLDLLPSPCGTTPRVLAEVQRGLGRGASDVVRIEELVKSGRLAVRDAPPVPEAARLGLDPAEASVLQLALDQRLSQVIVDDYAAIKSAKVLGLTAVSTPFLLLRARHAGMLSQTEFRALVDRLVGLRYFLSAPLYHQLLDAGERPPGPP